MFFDEIIHGTQYYRAPTPLAQEWEGDIARFEEFGLDAFQIRMNWRWNERREDEYDFSDVDRLLALAEKYGRKVVMKFLLECAPQYIYEKYEGTRIGPKGELLRPGSHGAFYGGWLPCFTNPMVWERALKFVAKVAERYAGNPNIILWNAWNEIRNKPIEECHCRHCRRAFGKYLEGKYGTVENLNRHYGAAEESFETINLPIMPHGFWDIYEFKKFKSSHELHRFLAEIYATVRKYDTATPIMCHAGVCSAFQTNIGDAVDDYNVSKAVDFWGTSLPFDTNMDTANNRLNMMLLGDFMRSVDGNYFNHEIYPGLGMFSYGYDTPFDMKFKLYSALASGAKGIVYWQYRAERVGMEQDCAGIMRVDGTPRPVAYEIQRFGKDLRETSHHFAKAEVEGAKAAIVFDYDSMLMSEIEESAKDIFKYTFDGNPQYYLNTHKGAYKLFRSLNYNVDYVNAKSPEEFRKYKVLYFPYYSMLDEAIIPHLEKFLLSGGTVIADEGFGLRDLNTWMRVGDINLDPIMTARLSERRFVKGEQGVSFMGERLGARLYTSEIKAENAEVVAEFDSGAPAVHLIRYGRGKIYLSGIALGYTYAATGAKTIERFFTEIMAEQGIAPYKYADFVGGIYEKRLRSGENTIVFIFNLSDADKTATLDGDIIALGADAVADGRVMTVKSGGIGYAVVK